MTNDEYNNIKANSLKDLPRDEYHKALRDQELGNLLLKTDPLAVKQHPHDYKEQWRKDQEQKTYIHSTNFRPELPMTTGIDKTLEERGNRYGEFDEHARITQNIKRAMLDSPNIETMPDYMLESLSMIAHKIGRILNGDPYYIDSWRDCVGYIQLVVDLLDETDGATDVKVNLKERKDGVWKEVG